jgi:hypothetical protein
MHLLLSILLLLSQPKAQQATQPRVVSVENAGLLFTDNPAGVTGADAGYSIDMGTRTLWLFGDIFLQHPVDPAKPSAGFISNSGLLVPNGKDVESLRSYSFLTDSRGIARQVITRVQGEDDKVRLWPFGGWYDAAKRQVYLYYGMLRVTGNGPLDFRLTGHGIARADARDPAHLQFERLKNAQGEYVFWPAEGHVVFGSAVVGKTPASDPYLYIVGYREGGGKRGIVARVQHKYIADLTKYKYYAGGADKSEWVTTPDTATDIEGLREFPTELSVNYNAYLGGYLAVHSVGVEPKIRLSLAPNPWGPYKQIAEIAAPHRAFEKAFCYAGKEHPELAEQGGKVIYVTYVDSQRYWLQLLKVTLGR